MGDDDNERSDDEEELADGGNYEADGRLQVSTDDDDYSVGEAADGEDVDFYTDDNDRAIINRRWQSLSSKFLARKQTKKISKAT